MLLFHLCFCFIYLTDIESLALHEAVFRGVFNHRAITALNKQAVRRVLRETDPHTTVLILPGRSRIIKEHRGDDT